MIKHKTIRQLEREYNAALAAEHRAVEAVPEIPPRTKPTAAAVRAAERAWEAARKTNEARAALTAALDECEGRP